MTRKPTKVTPAILKPNKGTPVGPTHTRGNNEPMDLVQPRTNDFQTSHTRNIVFDGNTPPMPTPTKKTKQDGKK